MVRQKSFVVRLQAAQRRGETSVGGGQGGVVRQEGLQVLRESLMVGLETCQGGGSALVIGGESLMIGQETGEVGCKAVVVGRETGYGCKKRGQACTSTKGFCAGAILKILCCFKVGSS